MHDKRKRDKHDGYTADFNGYKEEIILYSSNVPTEYSFEIYCEGLEAVNNSGILEFFDENTKEKIFSTDPFYIYDSSEEIKEYIDHLRQVYDLMR